MDKTLLDAVAVANEYGLTDREVASVVEAAVQARRDAAGAPGSVTVVHPDVGEIHVHPEAVPIYERSGWTVRAEEPPDDEPKPAKASKAAAKKES